MMLMARRATPAQKVRRHVALSAAVTALGGLLFGYDTGVVSGALLFLQKDFGGLSSFQEELVTSLLLVGAVVGALLAGRVADLIGRRLTVLITAAVFVVGVLLAAFTPTYPVLLVARIIIGLAVGSASMVVPLYIGEVVPPRVRGGLVSLNQLAITSGILVSYLIDYGLSGTGNWRLMFGLAAIPAVLLFTGMLFQQESPHWLIRQDRIDEARNVLKRVRDSDDIEDEVHDVLAGQPQAGGHPGAAVAQAAAAAVRGRAARGVPADHRHQHGHLLRADPVAGGRVRQLGRAAGQRGQRRGQRRDDHRRHLAARPGGPTPAAAVRHGGHGGRHGDHRVQLPGRRAPARGAGVVAMLGLLIYTGSFAIGLGPVFWLLIAEIYPLRIRGAAMSVATMANWGANFVVTVSFLTLLNAIDGVGVFFLFGFLTLVALAYFWRKVPETKGRSLQEIERQLTGQRDREGLQAADQRARAELEALGVIRERDVTEPLKQRAERDLPLHAGQRGSQT